MPPWLSERLWDYRKFRVNSSKSQWNKDNVNDAFSHVRTSAESQRHNQWGWPDGSEVQHVLSTIPADVQNNRSPWPLFDFQRRGGVFVCAIIAKSAVAQWTSIHTAPQQVIRFGCPCGRADAGLFRYIIVAWSRVCSALMSNHCSFLCVCVCVFLIMACALCDFFKDVLPTKSRWVSGI